LFLSGYAFGIKPLFPAQAHQQLLDFGDQPIG